MLSQRSYHLELLDGENIPAKDLYQNLKELDFINTYLGGHSITLEGLKSLLPTQPDHSLTVADVGCGGGDNLKYLAKWARRKNLSLHFVGIDIKKECIDYAKQNCQKFPEITFLHSDYREINGLYDIIFSALFCHHLNDPQMDAYLHWCQTKSRVGWYINDLHRHPLAFFSIKYLTKIFSSSYLVRHDAPLSVKRGFTKKELTEHCAKSAIPNCQIRWKWAFRYLLWSHH